MTKKVKLTSSEMKYYLMAYGGYIRHMPVAATEVTVPIGYIEDVVLANNKEVWAIEIKCIESDFKVRDFEDKDTKHRIYLANQMGLVKSGQVKINEYAFRGIPNRFFYAAEEHLIPIMQRYLEGSPYGIIQVNPEDLNNPATIIKSADKLHNFFPQRLYDNAIKRMRNEIISLYKEILKIRLDKKR